ncbi:hypothetical protein MVEN_00032200 [Mycena venus]|uniref:Uncharacterized protein n=1 Tax=Mycena venus TaxID=2733690 RepID=A0A8H7DHN9_9AGAR|nr:hypothetical protein MVEN_00032200 [Mycena venus]
MSALFIVFVMAEWAALVTFPAFIMVECPTTDIFIVFITVKSPEASDRIIDHGSTPCRFPIFINLKPTFFLISYKRDDSDADDGVLYFCTKCDNCPLCDSKPKDRVPPLYVVSHDLRLTVPLSVPIIIFLTEALFLGDWRPLLVPHIIGLIFCYI